MRCTTDILPGTYVADYIGEIMNEDEGPYYKDTKRCIHTTLNIMYTTVLVENRGLGWGDDYLFNLDNMQRCNGSIFEYFLWIQCTSYEHIQLQLASKKITAMDFTEKRASLPKVTSEVPLTT